MKSFAHVTMEKGAATLRSFEQVPREDAHNIQTHAVDLTSLVSHAFNYFTELSECKGNLYIAVIGLCLISTSLML